jgi:hypothetical protein
MEQNNNEIDLADLSVKLYHSFLRRYKLLGVFIAIGFIYGIYTYLNNKNQFINRTLATSYFIPASIIVDMINSLNTINGQSKELLSKTLNISPDQAKELIEIKGDTIGPIFINDLEKITTIEINIKGTKSLNNEIILKGLTNYIDSNEYVRQELKLERQKSTETILTCEQQIKNLDSLQKNILTSSMKTNYPNTVNSIKLNDKAYDFFHFDIIKLEQTKYNEQKKLARMKGLCIINQNSWLKTKSVSLYNTILKKILFLFGLGIFICLILEFRRFVKKVEKVRNKNIIEK